MLEKTSARTSPHKKKRQTENNHKWQNRSHRTIKQKYHFRRLNKTETKIIKKIKQKFSKQSIKRGDLRNIQ